jgi:type IV secretory pathway protease TraF
MDSRVKSVAIGGAALLVIGVAVFFYMRASDVPAPEVKAPEDKPLYSFDKAVCPGQKVDLKMADVYMRGLLEQGQMFSATLNWYACNQPKRGDIILYRFSHKMDPVVKRIVAVPGDKVRLMREEKLGAWTIAINGANLFYKAGSESKPYFFGAADVTSPLGLYAEKNGGIVGPNEVVVLSSFPPGDADSGTLGAISISDIIAIVDLNTVRPGQEN